MTTLTPTPQTLRVNETANAREAFHALKDVMDRIAEALTAADGMPENGDILALSGESRRLIDSLWLSTDLRALRGEK